MSKHSEQYKSFTIDIIKNGKGYSDGNPMLMSNKKVVVCFIKESQSHEDYIDSCKKRVDQYLKVQLQYKE